jgi:hypothetical protein
MALAQGPLYKSQRVEFPARGTYVEIRQERSSFIVWAIEHGDLAYGFRGVWGRDDVAEAFRTFADACQYEAEHTT